MRDLLVPLLSVLVPLLSVLVPLLSVLVPLSAHLKVSLMCRFAVKLVWPSGIWAQIVSKAGSGTNKI